MPLILAVALGLLLLFSYPWQTLSAGVIAYLIFLPLSVLRLWEARPGRGGEAGRRVPDRMRVGQTQADDEQPAEGLPASLSGKLTSSSDGVPDDATHSGVNIDEGRYALGDVGFEIVEDTVKPSPR